MINEIYFMEHIVPRFNFIVNIFFSTRCPPSPPRYKWFLWIYCKEQNRTIPMPWAQNVTGRRSWDPRDQSPGRRPSWNLCTDTVSSGSDVVAPAVPISRYPLQKKKCLNEACLQRIFRFRRQLKCKQLEYARSQRAIKLQLKCVYSQIVGGCWSKVA